MKYKYILFLVLIFSFCFVSAIPNDAGNKIDFTYPTAINYSKIPTVNSSDFWDALDTPADIDHNLLNNLAWSVAGHTIDTDFDIGGYTFKGLFNWTSGDDYNIFDGRQLTFNTTKLLSTYNATYANYETNVSINWTGRVENTWWTDFTRTDNSSYRELTNNTFYYSVNISAPLNVSRDNEVYLNEWIMNETGLFYNNGSREFNIRINSTHTVFNF